MRPPEGTLGSPEQARGLSDGAPPLPMCFGRVGAFSCSQLHLPPSLRRLGGEFSLLVPAAVQGVQHSSDAHSTPPAIGRTGTCPRWGCEPPPPPAPSPSHSSSQTPHLHDFSRQDLPCFLPAAPHDGESLELPVPVLVPVPILFLPQEPCSPPAPISSAAV